jgi:outer membrane protein OmpA-like peptidoglycan-associated protein
MTEDVARLKELLFENESRALSELSHRMDLVFEQAGTPERFTASVAAVLDDALRLAEVDRYTQVSHALAPLIVQTIKTEIRGSQDELAEALYPSLGRMVKAYVVSAITDLTDEINRRLESNPFMLRVRSLLTRRPVAELAFAEGQRLRVQEIYLIRRGTGALVGHWPPSNGTAAHDERVSGILTAINEVATEAFAADQSALRRIDLGSSLIFLRASPTHLLAAKCSGVAPAAVEQTIDDLFVATIERLRAAFDGGTDARVTDRAVNRLLAEHATSLDDGMAEKAKLARRRGGISPAAVVFWTLGLTLVAWAGWSAFVGYQTGKVRAIAEGILAKESALAGYPVRVAVTRRGRDVALAGLVPTDDAGQTALRRLRAALPASQVVDLTTALPSGLDQARADIAALQADLSRARSETARADAALSERVAGLETKLTQAQEGFRAGLKDLAAQLAQANADTQVGLGGLRTALSRAEMARQVDLQTLRGELARAVAPTARERLETWARTHAIFFAKDTNYRQPQVTAGALGELAQLIRATKVLVRVVGYTDEKGGEERNTPLSQARAQKVVADLIGHGVPAWRLVAVGRNDVQDLSQVLGEASPNRRVEFEIGFAGEGAP